MLEPNENQSFQSVLLGSSVSKQEPRSGLRAQPGPRKIKISGVIIVLGSEKLKLHQTWNQKAVSRSPRFHHANICRKLAEGARGNSAFFLSRWPFSPVISKDSRAQCNQCRQRLCLYILIISKKKSIIPPRGGQGKSPKHKLLRIWCW